MNIQLWKKDAQYQNLRVVRWNALVRSHYTRYLIDGLHMSAYGNAARNALIIQTLGPPL